MVASIRAWLSPAVKVGLTQPYRKKRALQRLRKHRTTNLWHGRYPLSKSNRRDWQHSFVFVDHKTNLLHNTWGESTQNFKVGKSEACEWQGRVRTSWLSNTRGNKGENSLVSKIAWLKVAWITQFLSCTWVGLRSVADFSTVDFETCPNYQICHTLLLI